MGFFDHVWVFKQTSAKLLKDYLPRYLCKTGGYKHIHRGKDYLYLAGTLPILLVAHVDTVHFTLPSRILYDRQYGVIVSPDEGLGGDDRAGVAMILEMVQRGHKPHILFTDLEERGCVGARSASTSMNLGTTTDIKYLVELDRRNSEDSCFYNCDNPDFETFVNAYGFKTAIGSTSDISSLAPAWGIAAVNLSTAYFNPHQKTEYVDIGIWNVIANKVERMLRTPPKERFPFIEKKYLYGGYGASTRRGVNTYHGYGSYDGSNNYLSDGYWDNWNSQYGSGSKVNDKQEEKKETVDTLFAGTNADSKAAVGTAKIEDIDTTRKQAGFNPKGALVGTPTVTEQENKKNNVIQLPARPLSSTFVTSAFRLIFYATDLVSHYKRDVNYSWITREQWNALLHKHEEALRLLMDQSFFDYLEALVEEETQIFSDTEEDAKK